MHRHDDASCRGPAARPAFLLLALALALPVQAAAPPSSSAEQVYQRERAACLDGSSQQDRATCLKEAAAARAEARRARLDGGEDAQTLAANARLRCRAMLAEDRDACERRVRGEGQVSGSVRAGGTLTTIVTRSPAASAPEGSGSVPR